MNIYEYAEYLSTLSPFSVEYTENFNWVYSSLTGEYRGDIRNLFDELDKSDKLAVERRLIEYLDKLDGKMIWGNINDLHLPNILEIRKYVKEYSKVLDTLLDGKENETRKNFLEQLILSYIEAYQKSDEKSKEVNSFYIREFLQVGLTTGALNPDMLHEYIAVFDIIYDEFMHKLKTIPSSEWFSEQVSTSNTEYLKDLDVIYPGQNYRLSFEDQISSQVLSLSDLQLGLYKLSYRSMNDYMELLELQETKIRSLLLSGEISNNVFDNYLAVTNKFYDQYSGKKIRRYAPMLIVIRKSKYNYEDKMLLSYNNDRLLNCYGFSKEFMKLFTDDAIEKQLILDPLINIATLYKVSKDLQCLEINKNIIMDNLRVGLNVGIYTPSQFQDMQEAIEKFIISVEKGEV